MYFMVPCDLRPIQSRGDFFNSGEHTGRKYFTFQGLFIERDFFAETFSEMSIRVQYI